MNKVPDICEFFLDIRYISKEKPETIIIDLRKKIGSKIKIEVLERAPPLLTKKKSVWLKRLAHSVQRVTGRIPRFYREHFASDGRFYSSRGIPVVSFGLKGEGLHAKNEFIYLESLNDYYLSLKDFLLSCSRD